MASPVWRSSATISSTACNAQARISTSSGLPWTIGSLGLDPRDEPGFEREHAVEPEHVGDEVVGEHRQPVEVGEVRRRRLGAGPRRRSGRV